MAETLGSHGDLEPQVLGTARTQLQIVGWDPFKDVRRCLFRSLASLCTAPDPHPPPPPFPNTGPRCGWRARWERLLAPPPGGRTGRRPCSGDAGCGCAEPSGGLALVWAAGRRRGKEGKRRNGAGGRRPLPWKELQASLQTANGAPAPPRLASGLPPQPGRGPLPAPPSALGTEAASGPFPGGLFTSTTTAN
nr:splicing factor 1-like [Macaca fascicularis]